jgi:hypothetical protein
MGFKEVRAQLIEALQSDRVRNEARADAGDKNLLWAGIIDEDDVVRLLRRCTGWEYSTSRHHTLDVDCHIFTPSMGDERWYIKAYLQNELAVFISVHR